MKLLRPSLRPLELTVPVHTVKARYERDPDTREKVLVRPERTTVAVHEPSLKFIQECNALESSPARLRGYLVGKYQEVFGTFPDTRIPITVIRHRIGYRIQEEAYRIAGITPPSSHRKNYKALMNFANENFEGCTRETTILGRLLTLQEGVVTMEAVKKVKKLQKAQKKMAKAATKSGKGGAREMVLGTYSIRTFIRWLATKRKLGLECVKDALRNLGVQKIPSDYAIQWHIEAAQNEDYRLPEITEKDHLDRIAKAIIGKSTPPKKIKKVAKPVTATVKAEETVQSF